MDIKSLGHFCYTRVHVILSFSSLLHDIFFSWRYIFTFLHFLTFLLSRNAYIQISSSTLAAYLLIFILKRQIQKNTEHLFKASLSNSYWPLTIWPRGTDYVNAKREKNTNSERFCRGGTVHDLSNLKYHRFFKNGSHFIF